FAEDGQGLQALGVIGGLELLEIRQLLVTAATGAGQPDKDRAIGHELGQIVALFPIWGGQYHFRGLLGRLLGTSHSCKNQHSYGDGERVAHDNLHQLRWGTVLGGKVLGEPKAEAYRSPGGATAY